MLPLLTAGLLGLGVIVTSRIVAFCCDEITEKEREKQDELRCRHKRYEDSCNSRIQEIEHLKQQKLDEITAHYAQLSDEFTDEMNEKIESAKRAFEAQIVTTQIELRKNLVEFYLRTADEKLSRNDELFNDIKQAINLVKEQLKIQRTSMRGNALEHFYRELEEALEKCKAYRNYINDYKHYLSKNECSLSVEIGEFEFILPKNYLYKGKLVFLTTEEIQNQELSVRFCNSISFAVSDYKATEAVLTNHDIKMAMLCLGYDMLTGVGFYGNPYKTKVFNLSQKRGIIRSTIITTPRIGITAAVTERKKSGYSLSYMDISLFLPWNKLENPKRMPPIGAELRVFPIKWNIVLDNIVVSEIASDSLTSYTFNELPFVIPDSALEEFKSKIANNRISSSEEEWKIAPYKESDLPSVKEVKFQLGNSVVALASYVLLDNEVSYFRYERILKYSEFSLKPEDVFAVVDCVLTVVLESEISKLDKNVFDNMASLSLWVFTEFKNQYTIKLNQKGMQYFNKWEEITDKLITYKYKGSSITIDIANIESNDKTVIIYFDKTDDLRQYIDEVYTNSFNKRGVTFFIEISRAEYMFLQNISADCTHASFYGEGAINYFSQDVTTITIYNKNFAYAEIQQKNALSKFRTGELTNKLLQVYALDGTTITADYLDIDVQNLYNKRLIDDSSQFESVKNAMCENNIFLIQGPPGTGKTTVIIEIVKQFMVGIGRVLIVSQANVAVDNVVKQLCDYCENDILRIGTADKIGKEVRHISFDEKYDSYLQAVQDRKHDETVNRKLLGRWLKIVKPEYGQNPDVGELLIRSHRIIGATCIGLAKKRIGLDRLEFDLTIIDEAGKALPAELLVPFVRSKKVIIIGDHMQLPPTIDTALMDDEKIEIEDREVYKDELFDNSFFTRLWKAAPDSNKNILTTQYRMPTTIGNLISSLFYDGKIKNGIGTDDRLSILPELFPTNIIFVDMVNDVSYTETEHNGITNRREVVAVCTIIKDIRNKCDARIAVITPYKSQKRELISAMRSDMGININTIDVNTVDAFQGDEAEIVIYCSTRAKKMTPYFSDFRRINVALSRAKNNLIIIGSSKYFNHYRKYKDGTVVLPHVFDYVKKYGTIFELSHFSKSKRSDVLYNIDIVSIHLVVTIGDYESDDEIIRNIKSYYYDFGKFDKPIKTSIMGTKFRIVDENGVMLYRAAQELGLSEIEIEIIDSTFKL